MEAIGAARIQVEVARTPPQSWDEDTAAPPTLLDHVPVVRVAIDSLVIADSPRLSGENADHIQALANAQGELPPITVHRASMRVLDGMHRLRAAKSRGQNEIEVRFFDGDDADAFVIAVRSNIAHGLPLSLADRKAAATRIIASHPQWSDRLVASVTGLAAGTIAKTRIKPDEQAPSTDIRIGRDGRHRPTNSTERRKIASKLLTDDPNLSLRQVARIAGISPETVRDVRGQLHDNDSTPPGRDQPPQPDYATHDKKPLRHDGRAMLEDLNQAMRQLRSDPTLRCTETGRIILRLLDMHRISSEKWGELSDNVPAHCKSTIANLAMECAETWKKFSEKLAKQDKHNPTQPII
jgi:ParB-like chromosome segregation protein Spo0J